MGQERQVLEEWDSSRQQKEIFKKINKLKKLLNIMSLTKEVLKREAFHLILEILLILSAVLIFRSAWELLDTYPVYSTINSLVIMLVIGIIVTLIVTKLLFRHEKYYN